MSKRFLLLFVVGAAFIFPFMAMAEDESPAAYCAEEAKDVGLVDQGEIQAYVKECVDLIRQEAGNEREVDVRGEGGMEGELPEGSSASMDQ